MVENGIVLPDGSVIGQGIGANTTMTFVQASAPIGWTKLTTHNNKTLRIVSGSVSSGGSYGFSSVFTDSAFSFGSGGGTVYVEVDSSSGGVAGGNHQHAGLATTTQSYIAGSTLSSGSANWITGKSYTNTDYTGSGAAHYHTGSYGSGHSHTVSAGVDLNVKYIDIILATKD